MLLLLRDEIEATGGVSPLNYPPRVRVRNCIAVGDVTWCGDLRERIKFSVDFSVPSPQCPPHCELHLAALRVPAAAPTGRHPPGTPFFAQWHPDCAILSNGRRHLPYAPRDGAPWWAVVGDVSESGIVEVDYVDRAACERAARPCALPRLCRPAGRGAARQP